MDKLVLDVETSNSFADVGGERNLRDLKVSFIGIYSYNKNAYFGFHENQIQDAAEFLQRAGLIIGFALNRFDIPVLEKYFSFNLSAIPRLDMLAEFEMTTGKRIGLNALAKANLGLEKTHASGLEAITLYREGKFEELKAYCLNDVKLTKELYEFVKREGHLAFADRLSGEMIKVPLNWQELDLPATLF
jgi:DEAD/DEAH box helicase domain-containing protein